jgi:hypothetical protein
MAFEVTDNAKYATTKGSIEPQIVLEIDGYPKIYGSSDILKLVRIGDVDLYIDGTWTIGGSNPIENQRSLMSFGSGGASSTSTKITQQLNTDTGESSGISSMQIVLVDKDLEISKLITPGLVLSDMLARRCRIWLGFVGTNYKDDFITIHRGIIDDITADAGSVTFNISHPDQKKRQELFTPEQTTLSGAITSSATSIVLTSAVNFLSTIAGPSGAIDTDLETLVQIDDEIIKYTGISTNTLTGCTRGYNATAAVAHSSGVNVDQRFMLAGNAVKMAEKIMLSGWNGPCIENISTPKFVQVDSLTNVANSIFIETTSTNRDYGLIIGDYVSVAGATNGANNFTNRRVTSIEVSSEGSYVVVDGAALVVESDSAALMSIRSQFDVWPVGLGMATDEVDVLEHERIYRTFLSSFSYRFLIKDSITGKEFIEKQLFRPASMFTIPKNAQSSVGYHIGPIPSSKIKTLSADNITNAKDLRVRRGIGKNFYNTVVYKFDATIADVYKGGVVYTSATSRDRIDVGTRPLVIESNGMRSDLFAQSISLNASRRRLNRYKYGAEYIDGLKIKFADGYSIDVGDILLADFTGLNVVNTTDGNRSPALKFYEVQNKSLDIKTGEISISLTDTNFSTASRYGLISPSSRVKTVISTTQIAIESSYASVYGENEGQKWSRYAGENIRMRDSAFTRSEPNIIKSVSGNVVTFKTPMALSMAVGDYLELGVYIEASLKINLLYAYMRDTDFTDGKTQYKMI